MSRGSVCILSSNPSHPLCLNVPFLHWCIGGHPVPWPLSEAPVPPKSAGIRRPSAGTQNLSGIRLNTCPDSGPLCWLQTKTRRVDRNSNNFKLWMIYPQPLTLYKDSHQNLVGNIHGTVVMRQKVLGWAFRKDEGVRWVCLNGGGCLCVCVGEGEQIPRAFFWSYLMK